MTPAYRIETERLLLRCWHPGDAPAVRAALDNSDAHLRPLISFMKDEPRSMDETADWLRGHRATFDRDGHYRFAVFDLAERQLHGEVMLLDRHGNGERELGYWIDKDHAGRGVATEASAALVRVNFDLLARDRLELGCAPSNLASVAVATKLGFTHEATLKQRFTDLDGTTHDLMVWTMFRSDYEASELRHTPLRAYDCMNRELALSTPAI